MGEGVAADATFTSLLGQRLTVPGSAIETMNFGVGGYGLGTSQALLRARGLQFTPDIVVQELGVAMLGETPETTHQLRTSFERTRKSPPTASFFETNSFAVFAIYPSVSLRARIAGLMSPPADTRPTAGDYVEEVLGRFGQLAGERKFLGVVFVPRPILAFDDRTLHERERETIRRDAVANKLVYIDSYDRFSPLDQVEALSLFPSELHPNAEAHRRHADALVEALTPLLAQR
jgi:lysophospholipase L1-like esterase